ncbi:MAG: helix-turn-helix transcriptional regulator [Microthrixaceae bacterium]
MAPEHRPEKFARLLNLVAALQATTVPLTADELRTRVPGYPEDSSSATFRRAFERDKDELRAIGVPIETVTVEHHEETTSAYRIRRDRYELPDPGLSPEELAALQVAATAVRIEGLDEDGAADALRKLGGVRTPDAEAPGPGAPAGWGSVMVPAQLPLLFEAVQERRVVRFRHGDTLRTVEPHRVQFERGNWYVSGHDRDRDAPRSFRLDRIQGDVELGGVDETFPVPEVAAAVRMRPWEFGDAPAVEAVVLLDPVAAGPALADDPALAEGAVTRGDGSVELHLRVRNPAGLRSFVLSFLDRAELVAPPELRADLVAWLERIADGAA